MTYVHCAACRCAFDVAASRRCPKCGQKLGNGAGAVEDEVADATAQLARALARATPAELDALIARIAERAPAADAAAGSPPSSPSPDRWAEIVLGAVGGAVAEERGVAMVAVEAPGPMVAPEPPPGVRALVAALVLAVGAHVTAMARARALPRLPERAAVRRHAAGLARRVFAAFA